MLNHAMQRAFTLIELLVVITVITILAALVVPAISLVKRAAWRAGCQAHLGQLAAGMQMYADDHREKLPLFWESGGEQWAKGIARYLKQPWDGLVPTTPASARRVFFCPGALAVHPGTYETFHGSYGMSESMSSQRIAMIPQPVSRILLGDGHWYEGGHHWHAGLTQAEWSAPELAHREGADFAFLDMHVGWLAQADYATNSVRWQW
ncbi:MAG: type II secretion system protein [Kiritimatiellae bacterium]|nr:type II secretion system protein [Kiritimatiellia bacterium]